MPTVIHYEDVPSESLLDETTVTKPEWNYPTRPLSDYREPYRSFAIAKARMQTRHKVLLETPRGLAVEWRSSWGDGQVTVLACTLDRQNHLIRVEDHTLITLTKKEFEQCKIVLTIRLIDPPSWL